MWSYYQTQKLLNLMVISLNVLKNNKVELDDTIGTRPNLCDYFFFNLSVYLELFLTRKHHHFSYYTLLIAKRKSPCEK